MRITNKIMRNNSLYNINQNKILEDHLSNQMTNQSKIVRPSDDPVIAIRALRLRSNVTSVSQYYDKNSPDADQWLTLTADALKTVDDVLTDLYRQATDASNKELTSADLQVFITQISSLTKEFYASANVDYAGRFVFSGYRTDTPITFTAADRAEMDKHPVSYEIHEPVAFEDMSTIGYTDYSILKGNADAGDQPGQKNELEVANNTLHRIRLSYDALDGTEKDIAGDNAANPPVAGKPISDFMSISIKDENGDKVTTGPLASLDVTLYDNAEAAYQAVVAANKANDAIAAGGTGTPQHVCAYIPSTGELVFDQESYEAMKEGYQFDITYNKSTWDEGDINPVHYFKCTETTTYGTKPDPDNAGAEIPDQKIINYNFEDEDQTIFYDVGFNQNIQVNTLANEVFTHGVQRDVDDLGIYLTQLKDIEKVIADVKAEIEVTQEGTKDYKDLQLQLDAAKKAYTYVRDNIHTKFENQITKYQKYMDANLVATTNNGTRGSRLELITTRLMNQKATFKDLQSNNEDVDVTEVAVELSSAELTYQAALMATSKIMQTNLMNYI